MENQITQLHTAKYILGPLLLEMTVQVKSTNTSAKQLDKWNKKFEDIEDSEDLTGQKRRNTEVKRGKPCIYQFWKKCF